MFEPRFQVPGGNAEIVLNGFEGKVHFNGDLACREVMEVVFNKDLALFLWQDGDPGFQELDKFVHIHLAVRFKRGMQHCFERIKKGGTLFPVNMINNPEPDCFFQVSRQKVYGQLQSPSPDVQ